MMMVLALYLRLVTFLLLCLFKIRFKKTIFFCNYLFNTLKPKRFSPVKSKKSSIFGQNFGECRYGSYITVEEYARRLSISAGSYASGGWSVWRANFWEGSNLTWNWYSGMSLKMLWKYADPYDSCKTVAVYVHNLL